MTGEERALLYRLALEMGLRAGELKSLTTQDIGLTVRVSAAHSKNRKAAELPLKPETAELLRVHLGGKLPGAAVFRLPTKTADMVRDDCRAAGIDLDDDGSGKLDFHALRHTFCTLLANSGVHPRIAQKLARHSTIELTMSRYTHVYHGQLSDAIDSLPDFKDPQQASQKATGTEPIGTIPLRGYRKRCHERCHYRCQFGRC